MRGRIIILPKSPGTSTRFHIFKTHGILVDGGPQIFKTHDILVDGVNPSGWRHYH
jgi:hypothetical protein